MSSLREGKHPLREGRTLHLFIDLKRPLGRAPPESQAPPRFLVGGQSFITAWRLQLNAPATSNKALAATSISCHRTTHTSEDLRPAAEEQPTDGHDDAAAAAAAVLDAERSRCTLALLHQHHRPTSEEQ
ncbi:hypothetical protein CGMCC3_g12866 [Colletotrichum fructicola]|nr:uncharacterized protein CGMCC3_g12866 [Colletotrichum fructicola]KAE9570987.1 hypothetical protein CGMCC3_g12866 [Colletotrichum fructicola]